MSVQQGIIDQINHKYSSIGENPDTYLKGLLYAKAINYWDYVEVDSLLSLQRPRTNFKDEEIFIMYHQVTELVLKMMLHEVKQLVFEELSDEVWIDKINRLTRYSSMLINSFDVMKYGMDYDDYNTFRSTLTPASGFQSAQFRFIEIYCTRLENLVNAHGKSRLPESPTTSDYFEHIYWKDAGMNRQTGKKTYTLRQFEEKYLSSFIGLAEQMKGKTIEELVMARVSLSPELKQKLKDFDQLFNIAWPMVHLETAQHFLDMKGENKAATGGSEWKKYLHPMYQQRKFFPGLYSEEELSNWGK